jgi:hypothetical protein
MNKIQLIEFQIHEAERMAKTFIRKGHYSALDRIQAQIEELIAELAQLRLEEKRNKSQM